MTHNREGDERVIMRLREKDCVPKAVGFLEMFLTSVVGDKLCLSKPSVKLRT